MGPIVSALVDIDRATEFAGDDVDRFSELVDLVGDYSRVLVYVPALDAAIVSLYIQRDGLVASVPVQVQSFDSDATGHFVQGTSSGAGSIAIVFDVGAVQHLRVHCSVNQTADRTFYLRGC